MPTVEEDVSIATGAVSLVLMVAKFIAEAVQSGHSPAAIEAAVKEQLGAALAGLRTVDGELDANLATNRATVDTEIALSGIKR